MMKIPHGWLAFELNVLRRLKFASVSLPFTGEPGLGVYLKNLGVRVHANDIARWAWTRAVAQIENNTVQLNRGDLDMILEDAYVPRHKLYNPSLRLWFNETDAWWFDNVRENIEKLENAAARALALSVGMEVGDYVLSFDDHTRELRQPLSKVFRQIWRYTPGPINNGKQNQAFNLEARDFIAEQFTELLFLRLPRARNLNVKQRMGQTAWREDWVHGSDGFWDNLESAHAGRLGTFVETKSQYLHFVEDLLQTAAHL
ncbi:MAG: hypothetical protein ABIZ95_18690, partial [Pyrinomonadaceae bacterium]